MDTLLGPERTRAAYALRGGCGAFFSVQALLSSNRLVLLVASAAGVRGLVVVSGLGGCSLFENYTVDASIFVAKLVRAHGGCLGIRSR